MVGPASGVWNEKRETVWIQNKKERTSGAGRYNFELLPLPLSNSPLVLPCRFEESLSLVNSAGQSVRSRGASVRPSVTFVHTFMGEEKK